MIPVSFKIVDRGYVPRRMKKIHTPIARKSWYESGLLFHATMHDRRFTHAHAAAAHYAKRKPRYERTKLQKFGHTYPLVFSGRAQRLMRTANITSTPSGASVRYAGARVFNFRNPKSDVNAVVEFTTILQSEADELAKKFDSTYDQLLNADQGTN